MKFDKEEIRNRVRSVHKQATNSVADVFATDVPDSTTRHVVAILVAGDGTNALLLTINRVDEDDAATAIANLRVIATDNQWIPEAGMDIEQDVVVLPAGHNLSAVTSANVCEVTVFYWDEND